MDQGIVLHQVPVRQGTVVYGNEQHPHGLYPLKNEKRDGKVKNEQYICWYKKRSNLLLFYA